MMTENEFYVMDDFDAVDELFVGPEAVVICTQIGALFAAIPVSVKYLGGTTGFQYVALVAPYGGHWINETFESDEVDVVEGIDTLDLMTPFTPASVARLLAKSPARARSNLLSILNRILPRKTEV